MPNVRARCDGTCVLDQRCEACVRCSPRQLCAEVRVTLGEYTTSDGSCCRFSFPLYYGCDDWHGAGGCDGTGVSLALAVEVINDGGANCHTEVSWGPGPDEMVSFAGVLPAGMVFDIDMPSGDVFEVALSRADIVENPLWTDPCSPCSCASFIPRKLCVTITGADDDDEDLCPCIAKASFEFDCLTRKWLGPQIVCGTGYNAMAFDVLMKLKPLKDRICGMDISVGGDGTGVSEVIFENALHPRKFRGTVCRGVGPDMVLGVPELKPCPPEDPGCEPPPPQQWRGIDASFILADSYGRAVAVIRISEQSCGPCEIDPISLPCCPCGDLPADLIATIVGPVCTDPEQCSVDGTEIPLTFESCSRTWKSAPMKYPCHPATNPPIVQLILSCTENEARDGYTWRLAFGSVSFAFNGTAACSPFELSGFSGVWFAACDLFAPQPSSFHIMAA